VAAANRIGGRKPVRLTSAATIVLAEAMSAPVITVEPIGAERQPLITIDNFAPDPDALRTGAIASRFGAAAQHYPGIRAPLPPDYWPTQLPVIAAALAEAFGHRGAIDLIDASFSVVTRSPAALTIGQRLPHCDSPAPDRLALVHYLSPERTDGTAFFRHRTTGYETIDSDRAPTYQAQLQAELRATERPAGYLAADTPLFERTAIVEARYNRAVLYRSFLLHSGAIAAPGTLSPAPATGRLTITAFFAMQE